MNDLYCYILMHSEYDWQTMIGSSCNTSDFCTWLWEKTNSYKGENPESWIV